MHQADYNQDGKATMGRSYGCPAFVPDHGGPIMTKIQMGSLFYGFAPVCASEMAKVYAEIQGWEKFCKTSTP